ncbi:hypothetical protein SCHPADRAFT_906103 [Schizopora paradoxa]|uniref:Uncharacterized protein n=1 Tax=Schizopora paradoxa TaxID=27342 RepID=A0A0H2RHH4_9AGAM|nr:hypothetical protein SCHPADRAFT_906103 [Schizopora paradoxa]
MPDNVQNSDEHTLLDVEDDDDRERRIRRLLRKTDSNKGTASSEPRTGSSSKIDFAGIHDPHEVQPPTQLLQRLQEFLPQLEADNAALLQRAQQNPESVDIEHLDQPDAQYIEMNLGLGVFTMRDGTGSTSSSSSSATDSESNRNETDDDSSSSDSDSDSESTSAASQSADHGNAGTSIHSGVDAHPRRPMRPLPNRARPSIVILGETDSTPEREQSA